MGWQPIETAPKDGRWLLIACTWRDENEPYPGDWCRIARWVGHSAATGFTWATMDPEGIAFGASIRSDVPTHWLPLPEPPQ